MKILREIQYLLLITFKVFFSELYNIITTKIKRFDRKLSNCDDSAFVTQMFGTIIITLIYFNIDFFNVYMFWVSIIMLALYVFNKTKSLIIFLMFILGFALAGFSTLAVSMLDPKVKKTIGEFIITDTNSFVSNDNRYSKVEYINFKQVSITDNLQLPKECNTAGNKVYLTEEFFAPNFYPNLVSYQLECKENKLASDPKIETVKIQR